MKKISVLDVTMRDGGCVNDFNFGQKYMGQILDSLENSQIDMIELGYLDSKNGSAEGRTQYCNEKMISEYVLHKKQPDILYLAMMDLGKFDVSDLCMYDGSGIDGIRLAFHKEYAEDIVKTGREILGRGYRLFIQPMIIMRYSDRELLALIDEVNRYLPDADAFYIVDSFGEMRANDLIRLLNIVDHNLKKKMAVGFHSHNNLQLSYSNAMAMLQFQTERNILLDSSIMGMGKGAGNLNTELLLDHLNLYYGGKYLIEPLLEVMDQVINVIHQEFPWGYAPEYYLSSVNHCSPTYARYYYNKHILRIDQLGILLGMLSKEKKISFDKQYAEKTYRKYNGQNKFDDAGNIKFLEKQFNDHDVLLIAPGRSISAAKTMLLSLINEPDIISVGLNIESDFITDFVFISRSELLEEGDDNKAKKIIPSNIASSYAGDAIVIDYTKWITVNDETWDSSSVMIINILKHCHPKRILLAGFDGFSVDISKNYYDTRMRRTASGERITAQNQFFKKFIDDAAKTVPVEFITRSTYQEA